VAVTKLKLVSNFKQVTYLGYMAILRMDVGYHFLTAGLPKITGSFLRGQVLPEELVKAVVKDPFAWHRSFILGVVVPHSHFFSYLVAFGETAVGISLLLGLLVKVSSSFGALHNLNILLSVALANGGSANWHQSHLYCSSSGVCLFFRGSLAKAGWNFKTTVSAKLAFLNMPNPGIRQSPPSVARPGNVAYFRHYFDRRVHIHTGSSLGGVPFQQEAE